MEDIDNGLLEATITANLNFFLYFYTWKNIQFYFYSNKKKKS
jgi:hypothetical protein